MSKTPSSKLFKLIKSLSGSEKRYFKLFVSSSKEDKHNKYKRLFDAIDAQQVYDDNALKKLIYNNQQIHSRKYSELKAYLYELVLKSLQSYDEKTSIDFRIKGMLQSVRVLYKRSHYDECKEMLAKIKKLAYLHEAFIFVVEALNWEKQVAYTQADIPFLDRELERINQEETECLNKLRNISEYQSIFYRLIIENRKDSLLRSQEKVDQLSSIMEQELLKDEEQALSKRALLLFFRIYTLYYYSILQQEKVYEVSKKGLNLIESNPHMLNEDVSAYIAILSNFAACCGLMRRFDEVDECLHKLQKIKPKTLSDELWIHTEYYSKKFALCIFTGEFDAARQALQQHLKELKRFDPQLFQSGRFYFQYFYIYFGSGDFDKALEYLNEWLNLPRSMERQDLQSLARILNLIIHFEMGNAMLLEYLLRSTFRYLRSRNRVHQFERRVLGFIRDSNKIRTRKELNEAFGQLKKDFEELSEIPSERVMFQYFDFIAWLESKIENKPFPEVVRERYQQKHL
ncbi:MAG: hypothetical protein AAGG75_11505 [Bacteroidota bacterium]